MIVSSYVYLALTIFVIGLVGFVIRRNAIVVLMCLELMLNAVNLLWVAYARQHGNLDGQIAAFFVMVLAAAEVAVGLIIIVVVYRKRRTVDTDQLAELKL
jgi:NADH-quinone oxidoreductase subunit K